MQSCRTSDDQTMERTQHADQQPMLVAATQRTIAAGHCKHFFGTVDQVACQRISLLKTLKSKEESRDENTRRLSDFAFRTRMHRRRIDHATAART
jgi:hypothetical protein